MNVIPGSVRFTIDIRDIVSEGMDRIKTGIERLLDKIREKGYSASMVDIVTDPPIALDSRLLAEMLKEMAWG